MNASLYGPAQNGAIVYVTTPVTATNEPKSSGVTTRGLFIYDAVEPNGVGSGSWQILPDGPASTSGVTGEGAYAIKGKGNLGLLDLGINLLSSNVRALNLPSPTVPSTVLTGIISTNVTNTGTDAYYTVPSTGIYQINYSYRTGQGIRAQLLAADPPGIIITRATSPTGTQTELDSKLFGGIQLLSLAIVPLALANISLTQAQISHIYQLNQGDVLRFALVEGGLALGVLTDASAELSIYRLK